MATIKGKRCKAGELEEVIDVKASRIRIVLNKMLDAGLMQTEGERKQRIYYK